MLPPPGPVVHLPAKKIFKFLGTVILEHIPIARSQSGKAAEAEIGAHEEFGGGLRDNKGQSLATVLGFHGQRKPPAFAKDIPAVVKRFGHIHLAVFKPASLAIAVLKGGGNIIGGDFLRLIEDHIKIIHGESLIDIEIENPLHA